MGAGGLVGGGGCLRTQCGGISGEVVGGAECAMGDGVGVDAVGVEKVGVAGNGLGWCGIGP